MPEWIMKRLQRCSKSRFVDYAEHLYKIKCEDGFHRWKSMSNKAFILAPSALVAKLHLPVFENETVTARGRRRVQLLHLHPRVKTDPGNGAYCKALWLLSDPADEREFGLNRVLQHLSAAKAADIAEFTLFFLRSKIESCCRRSDCGKCEEALDSFEDLVVGLLQTDGAVGHSQSSSGWIEPGFASSHLRDDVDLSCVSWDCTNSVESWENVSSSGVSKSRQKIFQSDPYKKMLAARSEWRWWPASGRNWKGCSWSGEAIKDISKTWIDRPKKKIIGSNRWKAKGSADRQWAFASWTTATRREQYGKPSGSVEKASEPDMEPCCEGEGIVLVTGSSGASQQDDSSGGSEDTPEDCSEEGLDVGEAQSDAAESEPDWDGSDDEMCRSADILCSAY